MNEIIHAREFSVRSWPPEDRLVALISGNFDDSQSTGDVWTVAGYVGYSNQWDYFEQLWKDALDRNGVPYFHLTEMYDPAGPFAKWLPAVDHADEVAAYFKDLVSAIRKCGLHLFSSSVWIKDLERFNQETGIGLEAYPLAAYACLSFIGIEYERKAVTAVFDRVEKVSSKLKTALSYAESDKHLYPGICDYVAAYPLQKPLTARDVPAMQAADLIAWEIRKAHFRMKSWVELPERPEGDRLSQWGHYLEWTKETTGKNPEIRKSLDALIDDVRVRSIVWDYQQLKNANEFRRGVWTPMVAP